jgi:iron complex transport system permease protein
MRERSPRGALVASFLLFAGALAACPLAGPAPLDWKAVVSGVPHPDAIIFFSVRLPRVLLALLAGAALSCAGAVFQTALRNPLACPYTLGVAGGASLGAVASFLLPLPAFASGPPAATSLAFAGSLLAIFLVLGVSSAIRPLAVTTLVLAGVAVNFLFNALLLLLHQSADPAQGAAVLHWLLGSLEAADPFAAAWVFSGLLPLLLLLIFLSRDLDLLAAGEEFAATRGVAPRRTVLLALGAASLLTGSVVAHTGPIGFVGLLVPHALRPFIGSDHRTLLACSALSGGAFLAFCDMLARTVLAPAEIPVGVVTALLGAPFFLFLLFRMKRPIVH